jgi:carboxymethylenebutenolidase
MCQSAESRPPISAIAGAAITHSELVLESADGSQFSAFSAVAEQGGGVGIVILPDNRGLSAFYEELALRCAELGYSAVAIDYFGRTAGTDDRGEDFAPAEHMAQTTQAGVQADIAAGIGYLRGPDGGAASTLFTLGCCFGGSNAWLAAASGHGIAGAIGFHGGPGMRGDQPGPTQRAGQMQAPILALQGGADPHITAEVNAAFDEALTAAGVEHEIVIEPGAPHSFFDRLHEEYAEQSADGWRRTLEFIEKHSSVAV